MKRTLTTILILIILLAGRGEAASLILNWTANTDDLTAGYNIYLSNAPRSNTAVPYLKVPDASTSTVTIPNLDISKVWFVSMTAYSESGIESDFSNELNTRAPSKPGGFFMIVKP